MIYTAALKCFFKIPLSPILGIEGFAFPSGHMLTSTILYGYSAHQFKNKYYRIIVCILLAGIGISLVHAGYHNYYDILGGIFFAVSLMLIYEFIKTHYFHLLFFVIMFIANCGILYIKFVYILAAHVWMAYYAILGFIISNKLLRARMDNLRSRDKILSTIICFTSIYLIKKMFNIEHFSQFPLYLSQLQWFIISFSIPSSIPLARYINNIYSNNSSSR
ncbi:MAG: phosphatase PAP2 family protein [Legionellales bacterium]|nr:phosphatase PAP2 family protein [Legionellales bacterium]